MKRLWNRTLACVLALVMCFSSIPMQAAAETVAVWDGIATERVYEQEDYTVTFFLDACWDGGYNAHVRVENTGDEVIKNWHLACELESGISTIWNAGIYSYEEGCYIIKNAGWNGQIGVSESAEFGFSGSGDFPGFPQECRLAVEKALVDSEDYSVTYQLAEDWGSGFSGSISVTNLTDEPIEAWSLEFDFGRTITDIWDGVMESVEGDRYCISEVGYNSTIEAGATVTFGFNGQGGTVEMGPFNYEMYSYRVMEDGIWGDTVSDGDVIPTVSGSDIDTEKDEDTDGVPDYVEDYFGTDTGKEDTDGDGLPDYAELRSLILDPLSTDTDGNGLPDGAEDTDGDGLSNIDEIKQGTDLVNKDTDGDELHDGEEVYGHGTNPIMADTDSDGVTDGKEVLLGTNPLTAEAVFAVNLESEEEDTVKVSVSAEFSPEAAETLYIEKYENDFFFPETMPGYLGSAYDFQTEGSFEEATIQFSFDEALLTQEDFEPVIYYFNEEEQTLEALETKVEGGVASAKVEHFSKYILLNRTVYEDSFVWEDVWDAGDYAGAEVVFVIDDSGSMDWNDSGKQRLTVARDMIDRLPENSKVGVVRYGSNIENLTRELLSDKEAVKKYLTSSCFCDFGGTFMYTGINRGFSLFDTEEDGEMLKTMVVLSDGATSDSSLHAAVVETAVQENIKIYTVGLGSETTYFNAYMKPLAEETGGAFYLAEDAEELADIYSDISKKIDIETDSDGDGLPDYYEEHLPLFNGMVLSLDKNNPDTDGDGLYDGEEVTGLNHKYSEDGTKVIVTGQFLSDPAKEDSDGDGLTDELEVYYYGTDAMHADTDNDGLIDSIEVENWYDPLEADADGDGRLDLQEYEEGTSPYSADKNWNDHVWDFICGVIAGDFIRDTDSLAVLLGQIVGGLTPIVADVRDVLANLAYKDYGFALLSGFGLATLVGDGAKSAGLVVKFILKNLDDVSKISKVMEFIVRHCPEVLEHLAKSDEFADAMKSLSKAPDMKLTKQEVEAIDEAMKKAGVAWDGIKSRTSSLGRMDLAGKNHPVSGVKFDLDGFPIFESRYNTKLDPQDYMKSRGTHFNRASKALYNDIMNDSSLRSKFTEAEIAIFKEGGVPKSYTWHHHQDEGVMQLVDRKIHRQTGHIGGFSIWGPGN